jgi:hypothetical protein
MPLPNSIRPDYLPNLHSGSENSYVVRYRPLSSLTNATRVDFLTNKSNDCIDLSATQMAVKFKLVKDDGSDLDPVVSPNYLGTVNNMRGSLFSSLTVSINSQIVTQCQSQPYLEYFCSILNNTLDYRETALMSNGFYEEGTTTGAKGKFFSKFSSAVQTSKVVNVIGKINSPLFNQKYKLLPAGLELGVQLLKALDDQFIVTDMVEKPRIELLECELIIRYIKTPQNVTHALQEALNKQAYKIPITKIEFRALTIPANVSTFSAQNLFINDIPSRIIATFIKTKDYKGDFKTSIFEFNHFNLKRYSFTYNNVAVPTTPINFNCKTGDTNALFHHVNSQLGVLDAGATPALKHSEFMGSLFLLCQSFTSDIAISSNTMPFSRGVLAADFDFDDSISESVTLLMMCEFRNAVINLEPDGSVVQSLSYE